MLDAAKRYLDAGLCVLPAMRAQKRPALRSWKQYQTRLPGEDEIDTWFNGGQDGLCLLTGKPSGNLELLDFDLGGELFEPWSRKIPLELLDRLVVETSQSGGWHVVYRCEGEIDGNMKLAQRADEDGRPITLIETRGEGGLFLCAPTAGYELVQSDLADPPLLTRQERESLLQAAWELNEYSPESRPSSPQSAHVGPVVSAGDQSRPGDDFNTRGDVVALLQKHGWRSCGERSDGNEHWTRPGKRSGTSATLKKCEEGLQFYVFSANAAPFEPNQSCSPFGVYALLEHNGDYESAARRLRQEGYGSMEVQESLAGVNIDGIVNAHDEDDNIMPGDYDPGDFPEHLLEVPGFIGDMAHFITETNHTHQPVLSLAGSLSFQGFLAGRKVRDQSNTRTNVYSLALVETCCGKERARTVCKDLLAENGDQAQAMFFERPASYQGVQKKVARHPQCILLWDEIGQSLRTYRKADHSPHLQGIMRTVTELFTTAGSIYCSDTHSDDKNDYTIVQPNLVVYGTSTPDELFTGLTLDSIRNGFCGRMILFEGDDEPEDIDQGILPPPPKPLVRATGEWLEFLPPGNDLNQVVPNPLVVPRTKDAKLVLGDLLDQQRESRRHNDPIHRALWGRAVQKANQLALIYACSEYGPDKARLQINRDAAAWACDLVRHTTKRILHMASGWIAEDEFHDKQNEVVRFVRGQDGSVSQNDITRRFQRWSIRVRNEVMQNLLATKQLVTGTNPKTGRGTWFFIPSKAPRNVNEPSARC